MPGRYDTGGSYQPLSPNFANFQILASPPANPGAGRSYFDLSLGLGVFANSIWNYASGGAGAITSVFGRIGVVVAASNDYTFAQIGSKPTTAAGYGITDVATLTGAQTLTNKTLTAPIIGTITNTGTITLPTSTDTLVGKATTDTLTNKTLTAPIISSIVNTGTLTLPTSTDTLIGKATTDILTNKTFDSAGTGNVFKINGVSITAVTGTGNNVLDTSPTLVTPTLGVASATTVNKITITAPATSATLTLAQGSSLVTSGANSITLTSTGATNVTLPTSGTLLAANQTVTLSGDISGSGATAITTAIGANKVTLAMMATLAAGKVIGQSGVSTATPVAVNVPILIASGTASAQATLDINLSTFTALYTKIEIQLISFIPATNTATLNCRFSTDGTTFVSSGYAWAFVFGVTGSSGQQDQTAQTDTTSIHLTGTASSTSTNTINGTMELFNPNSSAIFPMIQYRMSRYSDIPSAGALIGTGLVTTAQVNKGIRLLFSSGNITSGIYRVYGYV